MHASRVPLNLQQNQGIPYMGPLLARGRVGRSRGVSPPIRREKTGLLHEVVPCEQTTVSLTVSSGWLILLMGICRLAVRISFRLYLFCFGRATSGRP